MVVVDPVTRSPPLELSDVTIDDEECGSGRSTLLEAQSRHESSIATLMSKLATYGPGQALVCNVQATIDSEIREELGDGAADSEWVAKMQTKLRGYFDGYKTRQADGLNHEAVRVQDNEAHHARAGSRVQKS